MTRSNVIELAACRAMFRAPQRPDCCWADVEDVGAVGGRRACGRLEATTLGLCAGHLRDLFGLEVSA